MNDHQRSEAQRRVQQACSLIESAYRLHSLDPAETVQSVKSSIIERAQTAAEDVREAVDRL